MKKTKLKVKTMKLKTDFRYRNNDGVDHQFVAGDEITLYQTERKDMYEIKHGSVYVKLGAKMLCFIIGPNEYYKFTNKRDAFELMDNKNKRMPGWQHEDTW